MPLRPVTPLVALSVLALAHVHAAETLWREVIVRVYDAAATPSDERRAALELAGAIVSAASIDVVWRNCDPPAVDDARATAIRAANACVRPLAPGELALRIVRSGNADAGRDSLPLGDAMIDSHAKIGVLATVYFDRVERVAAGAGVERGPLLGRAIAHELAHLLMSTRDHGTRGLMRAVWLAHEMRRADAADWILGPLEVAAIQERMRDSTSASLPRPPPPRGRR